MYKPADLPMKVWKGKINNAFYICRKPLGVQNGSAQEGGRHNRIRDQTLVLNSIVGLMVGEATGPEFVFLDN